LAGPRRSGRLRGTSRNLALGFLFLELLGDIRKAKVLIAQALGHDSVVEGDIGMPAALFVDLESLQRFVRDIKTFRIALGSQKHVVASRGVYCLRETRVELDAYEAVDELSGTGILEPIFRGLHGIQRNFSRATIRGDHSRHPPAAVQIAADINNAFAEVSEGLKDDRKRFVESFVAASAGTSKALFTKYPATLSSAVPSTAEKPAPAAAPVSPHIAVEPRLDPSMLGPAAWL